MLLSSCFQLQILTNVSRRLAKMVELVKTALTRTNVPANLALKGNTARLVSMMDEFNMPRPRVDSSYYGSVS